MRKKCPYCGKRVSYTSAFFSRRKAEYVCPRCGKETRVAINRAVVLVFLIFALIALGIMAAWIFTGMSNNPLGIVLVALPFVIFALISPKFVNFEPLKKYKKSMEARKAGIEYSDNLMISEIEDENSSASDIGGQFQINADVFNKIKSERTVAKEQKGNNEIVSHSNKINKFDGDAKPYVHVINDVSENHANSGAPLKKIHSEGTKINRKRHYIEPAESNKVEADDDDVKEYKKPEGNKYSANRRF